MEEGGWRRSKIRSISMTIHDLYNGSEGVDNPTEHLLLPAVHPLQQLPHHPHLHLRAGRTPRHRSRHSRSQLHLLHRLYHCGPRSPLASQAPVSPWGVDNHSQLRLRHLCELCRLIPAEVPDILHGFWPGWVFRRVFVGQSGQVHPPGLRKIRAAEEEGLDVWNIQLPLLLLQRVGRTHHHLRTRLLQLHHLLPHHLCPRSHRRPLLPLLRQRHPPVRPGDALHQLGTSIPTQEYPNGP